MLSRIIDDVRTVPSRLTNKPREVAERARRRLHHVHSDGQQRLWTLQTTALERAGDLLDSAPELRGLDRVTTAASRVVQRRLDHATAVPVEGYADMNARTAMATVRELALLPLLKVQRWESANKKRKTVLAAIDKRLEELTAHHEPEHPEA